MSNSIIYPTSVGYFSGIKENNVTIVKNIRYAKSERYHNPIPVQNEQFISDKIVMCPQNPSDLTDKYLEKIDINDCHFDESPQYLTITIPDNSQNNNNLPVVVWIHGGSYEYGAGSIGTSDPSVWVDEQHIIVVSLTFRLGIFGFLGGYDKRKANLGLLDIIEGLKWVKENIAAFGGDHNNITIMGQSAGGDAVTHLLGIEKANNLFKRAIIHSAPLSLRVKKAKLNKYFSEQTANIQNDSDLSKLLNTQNNNRPPLLQFGLKAFMPFGLEYGFDPLPKENEMQQSWNKNANKYDVLIGNNTEEASFFLKTTNFYLKYKNNTINNFITIKLINGITNSIYKNPCTKFANDYSKAGGNIYYYTISPLIKGIDLAAGHCIDLPLIFANEKAWKNAEMLKDIPWNYIFENGKLMRKIWADFARNGKISNEQSPEFLTINKV